MNTWRTVAAKELRTYFLSPVALIFILTFLLSALFSLFWVEAFFARGIADVRPLFQWLPVLLAFLVPALGMRLWSEEERSGTLEMLGTLPVPPAAAVLGKFAAGLALVGVALSLTLPVPLSVSLIGDLDWGPVLGGYLATMLLAGSYLAITLCVSATTANQLVALALGVLACGGLYLVGSDFVAGMFGHRVGEILRGIGAGARFDSIQRGVLDLRDLAYYASLIGAFFALNVYLLHRRRWSGGEQGAPRRRATTTTMVLLAANALALNLWVAPLRGARIDLTEHKVYSISAATSDLLEGLDEPLLIRGYFSDKTHPLLAPLVPEVRDMLEEYDAIGGERVTVEWVDPTTDPALEAEAGRRYGIRSVPMQFSGRHEAGVVNAFFHLLIKYGDHHEVLGFQDLVEVGTNGRDVEVGLRNLEYDLTKAIQKSVYEFSSPEAVFARLPQDAALTLYASPPDALPEGFREAPDLIEAAAAKLEKRSGGRLSFQAVDPEAPGSAMSPEVLASEYDIQPLSTSLLSGDRFYLQMRLQVGDHSEVLMPEPDMTESSVEDAVMAALRRLGPGGKHTVGLAIGGVEEPPRQPQMPGMPPQPQDQALSYHMLRQVLAQTYAVTDVDLTTGQVPAEVDVLLVLDPRDLGDPARWALDQYLMRGGRAVVATGAWDVDLDMRGGGLAVEQVDSGLDALLAGYGVAVGDEIVLDEQSATFPIPVSRSIGGFRVQDIQMMPYPAFVDVRADGLSEHPALVGLPGVVMHWPSPVRLVEGGGGEDPSEDAAGEQPASGGKALPQRAVLFTSSQAGWTLDEFDAQPDFSAHPEVGWPTSDEQSAVPLAVAVTGPIDSYFAGKEPPTLSSGEDASVLSGGVVERSPERARLAVLGSASFLSDPAVQITRQVNDQWLNNMQLVTNLVDWSLEDEALLAIRGRGQQARVIEPLPMSARRVFEFAHYGFASFAVIGIGLASIGRRRRARPIDLDPPSAPHAVGEALGRPGDTIRDDTGVA